MGPLGDGSFLKEVNHRVSFEGSFTPLPSCFFPDSCVWMRITSFLPAAALSCIPGGVDSETVSLSFLSLFWSDHFIK